MLFKALVLASEDGKGARRTFVTGAFHAPVAESMHYNFSVHEEEVTRISRIPLDMQSQDSSNQLNDILSSVPKPCP
jgi:hypothetical protein